MSKTPSYVGTLYNMISKDIQNGTFWSHLTDRHTHIDCRHVGMSDVQLLDRVFMENKICASSFTTTHDMEECVTESIIYSLKTICEKGKENPTGTYSHVVQLPDELYADEDDPVDFETHHKGFAVTNKGRVVEMDTNTIALILKNAPNSRYGFTLVSAFPYLETENAKPTGKDISETIKQTDAYQKGNAIDRTYMRLATEPIPNDVSIRHLISRSSYKESISVAFQSDNPLLRHNVKIDELQTRLTTQTKNEEGFYERIDCTLGKKPKKYLDLQNNEDLNTFKNAYPKIANYVANVQQILSEETKEINTKRSHKLPNVQFSSVSNDYEYKF